MATAPRIGSATRQLRKLRGLTQAELAEHIGRTLDAVSMIERGKSVPNVETLIAIAAALQVSVDALLMPEIDLVVASERRDKIEEALVVLMSLPAEKLTLALELIAVVGRSRNTQDGHA